MTESPQTPITRFRKRAKIYDFISTDLESDNENIDPENSEPRDCSKLKRYPRRTPLGQSNLNQFKMLDLNRPVSPQFADQCSGLRKSSRFNSEDLIFSSPELGKHNPNSDEMKTKKRLVHWNSMDNAQSPWPYLEVDQLAQLITQSVHITSSPKSRSSTQTPVQPSGRSQHIPLIDPTYTSSSSNSSRSHSSDDHDSPSQSTDPKPYIPKFERNTNSEFKQSRDEHHRTDFAHLKKPIIIIDCRYPYEFDGGHIRGAVNLAEWPKLRRFLFSSLENPTKSRLSNHRALPRPSRTVFVLHCEFSSHRAPQLFNLIRNHDRLLHFDNYPRLRYPKVYVLRGGYAAFYANYPQLCEPSSYLQMHSRPDLLGRWRRHCERVNRHYSSDEDDDEQL